jgi:hypothetical protein
VNPEKNNYALMPSYKKTEQKHGIQIANRWKSSDVWGKH